MLFETAVAYLDLQKKNLLEEEKSEYHFSLTLKIDNNDKDVFTDIKYHRKQLRQADSSNWLYFYCFSIIKY